MLDCTLCSCNNPNPPLTDIVCFGVSLMILKCIYLEEFSTSYKECFVVFFNNVSIRERFPYLIRNVSFSLPTDVRSHNPSPCGLASSLTHNSISGSYIICNSSNPLLTDIVCFGPLRIAVSLTILKPVHGVVSTPL